MRVLLCDACPDEGGQEIPDTRYETDYLSGDGVHLIEVVLDSPVEIPEEVWTRVVFTVGSNAGWIVGSEATVGYTANAYWHEQGGVCNAWFGPMVYAGFWGEVYAQPSYEEFTMDLLGNRVTYDDMRRALRICYDPNNEVNEYPRIDTIDVTYDANGNLTRTEQGYVLGYDHENRLISVTGGPPGDEVDVSYSYDATLR